MDSSSLTSMWKRKAIPAMLSSVPTTYFCMTVVVVVVVVVVAGAGDGAMTGASVFGGAFEVVEDDDDFDESLSFVVMISKSELLSSSFPSFLSLLSLLRDDDERG